MNEITAEAQETRDLAQEIERLEIMAGQYGLDVNDDRVARSLCVELAAQYASARRRGSSADIVQATIERVAGQVQGQAMLDEIQEKYQRSPTLSEIIKAGYDHPKPIEESVLPPPEGSIPHKLLDFYYKHLNKQITKEKKHGKRKRFPGG